MNAVGGCGERSIPIVSVTARSAAKFVNSMAMDSSLRLLANERNAATRPWE